MCALRRQDSSHDVCRGFDVQEFPLTAATVQCGRLVWCHTAQQPGLYGQPNCRSKPSGTYASWLQLLAAQSAHHCEGIAFDVIEYTTQQMQHSHG
jgi:hypothetical protein